MGEDYLPGADIATLGWRVCKSPYTPLGMETHYGCSPMVANQLQIIIVSVSPVASDDNILTLTRSTDLVCWDQPRGKL